jgi:RES domain-containing protein
MSGEQRSTLGSQPPQADRVPAWAAVFRAMLAGEAAPQVLPAAPPTLSLSGTFYRQTSPRRAALDLAQPAPAAGRYHRRGGQSPVYASSSAEASWGELFRHTEPGISPFETKRRMSELQVTGLRVLDITDPSVQAALGISQRKLVGNRRGSCQQVAAFAHLWPEIDGLLAPSAAMSGMTTLVIFPQGLEYVSVRDRGVQKPPLRLIHLLERVVESLPPRRQDQMYRVARDARREYRRRLGR